MLPRIALICNPAAGGIGERLVDAVAAELAVRGCKPGLYCTSYAGHGQDIARAVVQGGVADLIQVAGGDGSVRDVASGVMACWAVSPILAGMRVILG